MMQDVILVDWGTSSLRLWWLDGQGQLRGESRGPEGMQHCQSTGFAPVLSAHLAKLAAPATAPILICGMAGAKQGWVEAPYADLPAAVTSLAPLAIPVVAPEFAGRDIRILPGLAQRDAAAADVMRGEETQLLGLAGAGHQGPVCMPGTHCKWARLQAGAVTGFHSYMTGELFTLLARHSILRHGLPEALAVDPAHPDFIAALDATAADPGLLTEALFGIRAAGLLGFRDASANLARLSGLLIGAEVAREVQKAGKLQVLLLGQAGLGSLYHAALHRLGAEVTLVDAETATRQGLMAAAQEIWE